MRTGALARHWRVLPFDNAKTTPANRSLGTALRVHLGQLLRLVGAILVHRPALVHLHTCSFGTFYRTMADLLIARLLLRPVVLHVHGGHFQEFLNDLRGPWRWLVCAHLRLPRRIIVLGEVWRTRLSSTLGGERLRVVPNGVPLPPRPHRARRGKLLRIACIGDLSPSKAPEDLLAAVARLTPEVRSRIRVEFIGDGTGERRAVLKDQIVHYGLGPTVRLLGPLSPARTHARLRRSDIHVRPSRAEGHPMVLLEALACGLPSVVTRVGAVPETVTDGLEACIVEPGDVAAMADRLGRLLADGELRTAMGRAARRRAGAAFSVEHFHAALERVWHEAIETPSAHPAPTPALH
jgi:glycosyltransferase involved in cell wall biosynthesis